MESTEQYIEALIFASEQSIRVEEIIYCLQSVYTRDFTQDEINLHINAIIIKYANDKLAIELVKLNNGYQFLTKKAYQPLISMLQAQRSKKKLSQAALETLAVIAYKQPVTRPDIEEIRGVNCDYSIQRLLEKELITIAGKSDAAGKPILYGTSSMFMDYFGISSISELPQLKDLNNNVSFIGIKAE